jgi:hypothetical protein
MSNALLRFCVAAEAAPSLHRRTTLGGAAWTFAATMLVVPLLVESAGAAEDEGNGDYGRFDGDASASLQAGASAHLSEAGSSGALSLRSSMHYLHTVGVVAHYDEGLGVDEQPLARAVAGLVEVRPLFIGRFSQDMEHGPAMLDLFVDSFALDLGIYHAWHTDRFCEAAAPEVAPAIECRDLGMDFGMAFELPLLGRASSPYLALRGGLRWSLTELGRGSDTPEPSGLITLSFGYRHVFAVNVVDAGDPRPP